MHSIKYLSFSCSLLFFQANCSHKIKKQNSPQGLGKTSCPENLNISTMGNLSCYTFQVPLDYSNLKDSNKIDLLSIRITNPEAKESDPKLVLLTGGPGPSNILVNIEVSKNLLRFAKEIFIIEYRGNTYSNPELKKDNPKGDLYNLTYYNSISIAKDQLKILKDNFNITSIIPWGKSYGALIAQTMAHLDDQKMISKLVLDHPVPLDYDFFGSRPKNFNNFIKSLVLEKDIVTAAFEAANTLDFNLKETKNKIASELFMSIAMGASQEIFVQFINAFPELIKIPEKKDLIIDKLTEYSKTFNEYFHAAVICNDKRYLGDSKLIKDYKELIEPLFEELAKPMFYSCDELTLDKELPTYTQKTKEHLPSALVFIADLDPATPPEFADIIGFNFKTTKITEVNKTHGDNVEGCRDEYFPKFLSGEIGAKTCNE